MKKDMLIATIEDEITELTAKKGRYTIWTKQELNLIKGYADDKDIWASTRTLKAHIDKIEQYKSSIIATEGRIDTLKWVLDLIKEEGGSNE